MNMKVDEELRSLQLDRPTGAGKVRLQELDMLGI